MQQTAPPIPTTQSWATVIRWEVVMEMSAKPRWIAMWLATGLTIGQIVLLIVMGAGDVRWLRLTGFAIWALAAVFGWLPIYQFKRAGGVAPGDSYMNTTRVVDTGLYSIVRHPQFVAWPLMNIAVTLVAQTWVVGTMGAAALILGATDFARVDARNIEKFGDDYRIYMGRVPGWNFVLGTWRRLRRHR